MDLQALNLEFIHPLIRECKKWRPAKVDRRSDQDLFAGGNLCIFSVGLVGGKEPYPLSQE